MPADQITRKNGTLEGSDKAEMAGKVEFCGAPGRALPTIGSGPFAKSGELRARVSCCWPLAIAAGQHFTRILYDICRGCHVFAEWIQKLCSARLPSWL